MSSIPLAPLVAIVGLLAAAAPAIAADSAASEKAAGSAKQSGAAQHGPAARAEPQTWSPQEIAAAQAHCAAILTTVQAVTLPEEPFRAGACGTPAPVKLISLGTNPQIALSPPPTLTCDMVAALASWLEQDVQPLARKHLRAPVIRLETMSSYSCRNALWRTASRLSEHGRANALDIGAIMTSAGETTTVLASWGPTAREIRAQVIAAELAEAERKAVAERAAQQARVQQQAVQPAPVVAVDPSGRPGSGSAFGTLISGGANGIPSPARSGSFGLTGASRLGGPKQSEGASITEPATQSAPAAKGLDTQDRRMRFLREAHAAACKHFGTVLGPEANTDHRNHFHVDMAERNPRSHFCE